MAEKLTRAQHEAGEGFPRGLRWWPAADRTYYEPWWLIVGWDIAVIGLPEKNPLWDASFAIEDKFCAFGVHLENHRRHPKPQQRKQGGEE